MFRFRDLPAEVRLLIYRVAFSPAEPEQRIYLADAPQNRDRHLADALRNRHNNWNVALLRTGRQIYDEAVQAAYNANRFAVVSWPGLERIGRRATGCLRDVQLGTEVESFSRDDLDVTFRHLGGHCRSLEHLAVVLEIDHAMQAVPYLTSWLGGLPPANRPTVTFRATIDDEDEDDLDDEAPPRPSRHDAAMLLHGGFGKAGARSDEFYDSAYHEHNWPTVAETIQTTPPVKHLTLLAEAISRGEVEALDGYRAHGHRLRRARHADEAPHGPDGHHTGPPGASADEEQEKRVEYQVEYVWRAE